MSVLFACCEEGQAQTTTYWDGNTGGSGSSWATSANWNGDVIPPNAADSHVVIDDRNGTGTISTLSISASRTLGTITFDNVNAKLSSTLNVDTNFSGTSDRTLTLHGGIVLQNTDTSVIFRGNNGALTISLAADNVFSTSAESLLRINDEVVVTGSGKITKTGSGTLYIEGGSTYAGGTDIESGTVQVGRSAALGTGDVKLGSLGGGDASLIGIYAGYTHANNIEVVAGSGGTLTLGYTSTSTDFTTSFTGDITLNDDLVLFGNSGAGNGFRLRGEITGSSGITKTGNGRIRIEGGNSGYTGTTTISEGILQVGNGSTTGTLGSGSVINDASLILNRSDSFTFNNMMSGAGSLTKAGDGTVTISNNANTYSGGTVVASGTLRIGASNSLGAASGTVTLGSAGGGSASLVSYLSGWTYAQDIVVAAGSGGTLTLGHSSSANFSSRFTGDVELNDVLVVDSVAPDGFAMRLEGVISGTGTLTKTGVGITRLENASTYTGGTTLSEGTLIVINPGGSATGSGTVTTAAGTILGGTGAIAPDGVNGVNIGGMVTPGVDGTAGTLNFTPVDGHVVFQSGGGVAFELFGDGSNDKVAFNSSGSGVLDFSGLAAGSLGVTFATGYVPELGHSFDLLDWSAVSGSGITGLGAGLLNLSTDGFDPGWMWDASSFAMNGVITIVLVPEPGRMILLIVGMIPAIIGRRR
ncbi:MAG: autotransporter-associated beta strand repeat-containing protein [Prosthecobacter sp.]